MFDKTASNGARPVAKLVAVTDQAFAALGGKAEVRIEEYPFKVGRENRANPLAKLKTAVERRLGSVPQLNNVYLHESGSSQLLHISREHFMIDWINRHFVVVDRESACGTIVSGVPIGAGGSTLTTTLHDGDTIVVGGDDSPFVFHFECPDDPAKRERRLAEDRVLFTDVA